MLSIAKAYVEECVRDHAKCQAVTPYPIRYTPLPTRLIDCSNPLSPRIVQTDANMYGLYVALSYVWGKDQSGYCTTEGNLAAHMERIDVAILPQTIQDAIRVTTALGVRFLWVDRLCIVQDSSSDLHHELNRMYCAVVLLTFQSMPHSAVPILLSTL